MAKVEKYLLCVQFVLYLALTIFSYAYVDLNLNFTTNPLILGFVSQLQKLGFYNRAVSTNLYIVFLAISFFIFSLNVSLFRQKKIGLKYLKLSVLCSFIVVFAYPFLSSDIFNYMFDAKIITVYHQNPYTHKALDFPGDEWIRFMRWVHRYSPYGPLWLGFSLVPTILGLGKFISTLFAFKIFIAAFHVLNTYLIYKILKIAIPSQALVGTALYALNPLVIIDGLANSHNDVVMAAFSLAGIYFLIINKKAQSYFSIILGSAVKYIPVLSLPGYIAYWRAKNKFKALVLTNLAIFIIFTISYSTVKITVPFISSGAIQVQFQSWYLFWTLPYLALMPISASILVTMVISFSALLRYVPFLHFGVWSQPSTTEYMRFIITAPVLLALIIYALNQIFFFKKYIKRNR